MATDFKLLLPRPRTRSWGKGAHPALLSLGQLCCTHPRQCSTVSFLASFKVRGAPILVCFVQGWIPHVPINTCERVVLTGLVSAWPRGSDLIHSPPSRSRRVRGTSGENSRLHRGRAHALTKTSCAGSAADSRARTRAQGWLRGSAQVPQSPQTVASGSTVTLTRAQSGT